MNTDVLLWIVSAVIIVVGITVGVMVWKGKKGYAFRSLSIGGTVMSLGVILLIVAFVTELSWFYAWYPIGVGALAITIGLVIRNVWEKKG